MELFCNSEMPKLASCMDQTCVTWLLHRSMTSSGTILKSYSLVHRPSRNWSLWKGVSVKEPLWLSRVTVSTIPQPSRKPISVRFFLVQIKFFPNDKLKILSFLILAHLTSAYLLLSYVYLVFLEWQLHCCQTLTGNSKSVVGHFVHRMTSTKHTDHPSHRLISSRNT